MENDAEQIWDENSREQSSPDQTIFEDPKTS